VVGGREGVRSSSASTESSARSGSLRGTVAGRMRVRRRGDRRRKRVGARVATDPHVRRGQRRRQGGEPFGGRRLAAVGRRRWRAKGECGCSGKGCALVPFKASEQCPGCWRVAVGSSAPALVVVVDVLVVAGVFLAVKNGALAASEPEGLGRSCWWCAARKPRDVGADVVAEARR
jgi:hypothetical protein